MAEILGCYTWVGRCRDAINYEHLYWQTCKAYTMLEFEENFVALQNAIPLQAHWLDSIGHEKWARSKDVPITSLLNGALSSLMIAFNQRRQYGDGLGDGVTPYANTIFQRRQNKAGRCRTKRIHDLTYEVTEHMNVFNLDYLYRGFYGVDMVYPLLPPTDWEMPNEMIVVLPPTTF
ncbi:hypothetical protein LXL04_039099 [Taraxacum kok-saghyz]